MSGKKEGNGVFRWEDGSELAGKFFNDMPHGMGRMEYPDGRVEGRFYEWNQITKR